MSEWDAADYAARDNLLRVVRDEAGALFRMAASSDAWTAPTACPQWQVRDIVGHLIDVTESYFVWQSTTDVPEETEPFAVGIRVSGRNAGDYRVDVSPDGLNYAQGDLSGLPAVIEFDPGSMVLTAFGRINAGTIRGDRGAAERFLNSFFRI